MEVKLDRSSWHYKLYTMTYKRNIAGDGGFSNKPPENLCPYFWSVVLALLISPVTFFGLGAQKVVEANGFRVYKELGTHKGLFEYGIGVIGSFCFISLMLSVACMVLFYGISFIFSTNTVLIYSFFLIAISLFVLYKTRGLTVPFFKAKLAKVCPAIDWSE